MKKFHPITRAEIRSSRITWTLLGLIAFVELLLHH
jgi:hypothetical protein